MRIITPLLLTISFLFATTSAFGQDAGPDAEGTDGATPPPDTVEPCDPGTLFCSNGLLEDLIATSNAPLGSALDTGWLPKCDPATPDGHCDDKDIQFRAHLSLVPLRENNVAKDIYKISMSNSVGVDARWPDPGYIDLFVPPGNDGDGRIYIAHSILPEIALYIDTKIYKGEIKFDAGTLIHKIPGSKFNYKAEGNQRFTPWAFENVSVTVKGMDLKDSKLFSIPFSKLAEIFAQVNIDEYVQGNFALNLTTNLLFQYQTTRVQFLGADGIITFADGSARTISPDDDYLDVTATVFGTMRYSGNIQFFPTISIESIGSVPINLTFPIDLKASINLGNQEIGVRFDSSEAHIPLPNVDVATTSLKFPTTETGKKSEYKTIKITNTGELGGIVQISSSSKQFKISSTARTLDADTGEFDLKVMFTPTRSGPQKGVITVKSNDPDYPEVTIDVSGTGKGENLESEEEANQPGQGNTDSDGDDGYTFGEDDSGCGCTVVGSSTSPFAGIFALLGFAAVAYRRHRKQRR